MQLPVRDMEAKLLTELEGAILSEIVHRGRQTAFKVRRSFAESPSLEWRGSAGAVYTAIKRLESEGLIQGTDSGDARSSRLLAVTPAGKRAMHSWARDATLATGVGIDPFRLRAGIWSGLKPKDREQTLADMRAQIQKDIAYLKDFSKNNDVIEKVSIDLSLRLQLTRLAWLDEIQVAS